MVVDISVIIPAYNAEATIAKCIESVLAQTGCSYEMVIVNDGSTDQTPNIIQSYQEKYSNIVYISQENKGLSRTKNVALNYISGNHFMILDSDDYLPKGIFKVMSQYLDKDLSLYSFTHYKNDKLITNSLWLNKGIYSLNLLFSNYENLERLNSTMVRLFKTSIQREHNLYYNANSRYSEDLQFNYTYYKYCKEAVVDPTVAYCVELTDNSLSRQFYGGKIDEMKDCYRIASEFLTSDVALSNTFMKLYKNFALDEIGVNISKENFLAQTKDFHHMIDFNLKVKGGEHNQLLAFLFNKKMYRSIYWLMLLNFAAIYKR
ncbi:glycosyltransferase family 2 protein [Streptococcus hillyeri]|uniref:Glycosyltransferase family 2 protein n=1 Tax=Streptococcus hillyeri TaxID=2282420 RepID=A0A3L9DQF8_9STRE|nr:glycosyltransferase family 2 protein [Streptococcus hillyeri]RLY02428.1 glycosyltransferase family 2 protein [Streptococcus hillyeri]